LKKEEKHKFVEWMKGEVAQASSLVVADYRGLTVAQLAALRSKCREAGVKFKVVKNTLMKLALQGSSLDVVDELLDGPTAVAWHPEDPGAPARVLLDFAKDKQNEQMKIKGGGVKGRKLSADEIKTALATLPTRSELLARLAMMLNSGPQKLHGVLSGGPAKLGYALTALKQQRESAGGGAPVSA
jgi:large subunit ribosomal protein L10